MANSTITGTRHQGPARLAARGAYAIVNSEARTPSQRETHFGYHLSHPSAEQLGEVQETLGIHQASSFVLQVKNPLAPPSGPGQVGLSKSQRELGKHHRNELTMAGGQFKIPTCCCSQPAVARDGCTRIRRAQYRLREYRAGLRQGCIMHILMPSTSQGCDHP